MRKRRRKRRRRRKRKNSRRRKKRKRRRRKRRRREEEGPERPQTNDLTTGCRVQWLPPSLASVFCGPSGEGNNY